MIASTGEYLLVKDTCRKWQGLSRHCLNSQKSVHLIPLLSRMENQMSFRINTVGELVIDVFLSSGEWTTLREPKTKNNKEIL